MSVSYALEKFGSAVNVMATSAASIQQRLLMAYNAFHPATTDDFPTEDMKIKHKQLMTALTSVKDSVLGYVPATVAQMTDGDAETVAELIYELAYDLRSWIDENPDKRFN